jgi:hypothetical protein
MRHKTRVQANDTRSPARRVVVFELAAAVVLCAATSNTNARNVDTCDRAHAAITQSQTIHRDRKPRLSRN